MIKRVKIPKISINIWFTELSEQGTQKRVPISHDKQAIGVSSIDLTVVYSASL